MIWLYYFILLAIALVGIAMVVVALPGLWLMLAAAAGYATLTRAHYLGRDTLIVLFVLALAAEFVEVAIGGAAAKKAGGGRRAALGGIMGGFLGGILFSFIPFPVLPTLVGICVGSFLGAAISELLGGKSADHSLRVGLGAAKGRFLGIAGKIAFGIVMGMLILISAWP